MSKKLFSTCTPASNFILVTQTINLCQRFEKRLRHLTVVEVEVFAIVLCAQTLEDHDQCSIHATETVKKYNIKKLFQLYMHA